MWMWCVYLLHLCKHLDQSGRSHLMRYISSHTSALVLSSHHSQAHILSLLLCKRVTSIANSWKAWAFKWLQMSSGQAYGLDQNMLRRSILCSLFLSFNIALQASSSWDLHFEHKPVASLCLSGKTRPSHTKIKSSVLRSTDDSFWLLSHYSRFLFWSIFILSLPELVNTQLSPHILHISQLNIQRPYLLLSQQQHLLIIIFICIWLLATIHK